MITKKKNLNADNSGGLLVHEGLGLCCDDKKFCDYTITVDTTVLSPADAISVDGTELSMNDVDISASNANRVEELRDDILTVLRDGVDGFMRTDEKNDIEISVSGNNMTIKIKRSTLVFNYLSTDTYPFVASNCDQNG